MAPSLYMILPSPPVRAVLMCAKAIGLDLNYIDVNLLAGEHLAPEYLKLNPQHTVPVLDDDGFVLIDSHAIMAYLVGKYGKDDSLYPNDLQKRSIIDHRLHFDSGVLFVRGLVISRGLLFEGVKAFNPQQVSKLEEAYHITEKFLEKTLYIAGDNVSIADFSIVTSLTTFGVFLPIDEMKYPKITAYIKRMEKLPYYKEGNQIGLDVYKDLMIPKLPK